MNAEKLKRLQSQVRIGGKGTPRRKKKVVHQTAATDDKKLQSALKKLSVSTIPGIEEVNIIKDDLTVLHFNNPKAQASLSANTFAVTGHGETMKIVEMLPEILPQLGQETVVQLRMFANTMSDSNQKQGTIGKTNEEKRDANALGTVIEEDDDVPMLVSDFEEFAKQEESQSQSQGVTQTKGNVQSENKSQLVEPTEVSVGQGTRPDTLNNIVNEDKQNQNAKAAAEKPNEKLTPKTPKQKPNKQNKQTSKANSDQTATEKSPNDVKNLKKQKNLDAKSNEQQLKNTKGKGKPDTKAKKEETIKVTQVAEVEKTIELTVDKKEGGGESKTNEPTKELELKLDAEQLAKPLVVSKQQQQPPVIESSNEKVAVENQKKNKNNKSNSRAAKPADKQAEVVLPVAETQEKVNTVEATKCTEIETKDTNISAKLIEQETAKPPNEDLPEKLPTEVLIKQEKLSDVPKAENTTKPEPIVKSQEVKLVEEKLEAIPQAEPEISAGVVDVQAVVKPHETIAEAGLQEKAKVEETTVTPQQNVEKKVEAEKTVDATKPLETIITKIESVAITEVCAADTVQPSDVKQVIAEEVLTKKTETELATVAQLVSTEDIKEEQKVVIKEEQKVVLPNTQTEVKTTEEKKEEPSVQKTEKVKEEVKILPIEKQAEKDKESTSILTEQPLTDLPNLPAPPSNKEETAKPINKTGVENLTKQKTTSKPQVPRAGATAAPSPANAGKQSTKTTNAGATKTPPKELQNPEATKSKQTTPSKPIPKADAPQTTKIANSPNKSAQPPPPQTAKLETSTTPTNVKNSDKPSIAPKPANAKAKINPPATQVQGQQPKNSATATTGKAVNIPTPSGATSKQANLAENKPSAPTAKQQATDAASGGKAAKQQAQGKGNASSTKSPTPPGKRAAADDSVKKPTEPPKSKQSNTK